MARDTEEIRIDKDAARAGSTPHIVRYILIISTLLAIIALSAIWIFGASHTSNQLYSTHVESQAVAKDNAKP